MVLGICRNRMISGKAMRSGAPTSAPLMFPLPPIMTRQEIKMDSSREKVKGSMKHFYKHR